MTKYYLTTIAVLTLYIGLTLPYTTESLRHHVAIRVASWQETKAIYKDQNQVEINMARFEKVTLPTVKGVN